MCVFFLYWCHLFIFFTQSVSWDSVPIEIAQAAVCHESYVSFIHSFYSYCTPFQMLSSCCVCCFFFRFTNSMCATVCVVLLFHFTSGKTFTVQKILLQRVRHNINSKRKRDGIEKKKKWMSCFPFLPTLSSTLNKVNSQTNEWTLCDLRQSKIYPYLSSFSMNEFLSSQLFRIKNSHWF